MSARPLSCSSSSSSSSPLPLDELVEERAAEPERVLRPSVDGRSERVDVHARLLDLDRMPGDPELPEVGRHLRVELDAPRLGAVDPERLVRGALAAREDGRSRRRLEHVVVPLVDALRGAEYVEDRVVPRAVGRDDLDPAGLGLGGPAHVAAQSPREDLPAEADAEHGHAALHGPAQQQPLRSERRHPLLVPGVCVAPHRDDPGEVGCVEFVDPLVPRAEAAEGEPGRLEALAEEPEPPERVLLLDDEDRLHGADASRDRAIESSAMAATTKRARPAVRPEALDAAFTFPALDAIFTRRARRFALGAAMTGPLAFRSEHEPVPLAYEEE